jgi:protein-S-isoprenylcysteine O-methyltransferase Ste14
MIRSQLGLRSVVGLTLLAVVLFLAAGRLNYWQGWVFLQLNLAFLGLTALVLHDNPSLIRERLFPGEGMKIWDKLYFGLSTPLFFASLVVACLDRGRMLWLGRFPAVLYIVGIAGYVGGQSLMLWAKSINHFFSSVVRIQGDRGHCVCREGPYGVIRHPGYLGGLVFGLCMPLVLGSIRALIPSGIAALLLVIRTGLEDSTLLTELAGYREYANAVRFRLFPGIW